MTIDFYLNFFNVFKRYLNWFLQENSRFRIHFKIKYVEIHVFDPPKGQQNRGWTVYQLIDLFAIGPRRLVSVNHSDEFPGIIIVYIVEKALGNTKIRKHEN